MAGIISLQLEHRVSHFTVENIQQIVDELFGEGSYLSLLRRLDKEITAARRATHGRATLEEVKIQEEKRLQRILEMQSARRYRKTKIAKLEQKHFPTVREMRKRGLVWKTIVSELKRCGFEISEQYLKRTYTDWEERLQGNRMRTDR
jgi:hypothetical protein